ncbi:hypothetical protein JKP88DRAFT_157837 [Tribonema minus]|uniref:Uncharacterized protein n=1 Tax=Tribonema minus TaxID=303371 RepID=A0A835Z319_9STRA|nr:hypothetical protein JKP88DRAFT_157837 [Tribonema minus]
MGLDHRFALQSIINGNGFLEDGKRFLEDTSTLERCYSEKRIPWESKVRLRLSAVRADIELHISLAQHGGTEGAASAAAVLPHAAVDAITLVVHPWERISGVVQRASRAFFPAGVPQAELHTLTKGSADVGRTTSLDSAVYDFSSKLHHGAQLSFERYVSHDSGAVYVKTLTGKTVALAAVVADTTVDKLKQMFQDAQSIPPDQQRLRWRGKMLEDSRTVSDYGMKFCPQLREPTLQLELRLRGGGCVTGGRFADVADLNAISHMAFSHNAPAWRVACPGLNVEGVCGTTGCRARGKMVIRGVGMGAFTLGDACACPLCRRPFAPVTCAFHACAWMFEGVKAGGGAALGGVWREAGDAYERFNTGADGESGGSMVEWERLVLVAKYRGRKRIPAADAAAAGGVAGEPAAALASGSGAQVDDCAVCLEPLHSWHVSLQAAVTPCGHVYHEACLKAWRRSSSASNGTCPSCRANL